MYPLGRFILKLGLFYFCSKQALWKVILKAIEICLPFHFELKHIVITLFLKSKACACYSNRILLKPSAHREHSRVTTNNNSYRILRDYVAVFLLLNRHRIVVEYWPTTHERDFEVS